jgi:hypothetical protein
MEMVDWCSPLISPGDRYGRYTVLSTHKKDGTYRYYALCQCDCGSNPRYVFTGGLRNGGQKSCGCLQRETATTHGLWKNPIFKVWKGMMSRCYKETDKRYNRYGGRGIDVCEEWRDVRKFTKDMSATFKPGLQIDRIDNDKGYHPSNCRWTDRGTQARNKSNIKKYSFDGLTMCLAEWSRHLDIPMSCLWDRLHRGWTIDKTLSTPSTKRC